MKGWSEGNCQNDCGRFGGFWLGIFPRVTNIAISGLGSGNKQQPALCFWVFSVFKASMQKVERMLTHVQDNLKRTESPGSSCPNMAVYSCILDIDVPLKSLASTFCCLLDAEPGRPATPEAVSVDNLDEKMEEINESFCQHLEHGF